MSEYLDDNLRGDVKNSSFKYYRDFHNEDHEKSRILISPKRFEEYGIPYRESLRSVYEKC